MILNTIPTNSARRRRPPRSLGGALAGAATGLALFPAGGPISAAVGAIAGAIVGTLGVQINNTGEPIHERH